MTWPPCVARAIYHASAVSARYYALPLYLVGSALTSEDPRDIDLVVPVPADLFQAMFDGDDDKVCEPTMAWRRWAIDCAKQSRELTTVCRRQVDFRTQPQDVFDGFRKPRLRIDCFGGWENEDGI